MSWTVPLTDLAISDEDVDTVLECLEEGWLTMGPRIQAFEEAFAAYADCDHAVAVSSGTAALHLSLLAAGVGPGDEVIVPGLTFVASAATVRYTGAEPVLADILGPRDFTLDPEAVERLVGERTKGVVAVHLLGYPASVADLLTICREHGLFLLEDAAQAVGAEVTADGTRAGSAGTIGAFSFFSKGQLAVGEGGMITTNDDHMAAAAASLRSHAMTSMTWDRHHGHADTYDVVDIGFNYRLDEARAALGLSRLRRLDADIAARRRFVLRYRELLDGLPGVELPWDDDGVRRGSHFGFPILLRDARERDRVRAALAERGVQTTWYPALTMLSAYATMQGAEDVPHSEDVASRHCCLPVSAELGDERLELVVDAVRAAVAG